tara:strand:- start:703 stop:1125 length:423 start_codon:yes stop_codon:yes gene_type:complete
MELIGSRTLIFFIALTLAFDLAMDVEGIFRIQPSEKQITPVIKKIDAGRRIGGYSDTYREDWASFCLKQIRANTLELKVEGVPFLSAFDFKLLRRQESQLRFHGYPHGGNIAEEIHQVDDPSSFLRSSLQYMLTNQGLCL